jgi:hypothetical protein
MVQEIFKMGVGNTKVVLKISNDNSALYEFSGDTEPKPEQADIFQILAIWVHRVRPLSGNHGILLFTYFVMHLALEAQLYESSGYHQIPAGEQFPRFGAPK